MVAEKAKRIASHQLEVDPRTWSWRAAVVRVKGSPDRSVPLALVAVLSNPMRYAFGGGNRGRDPVPGPRPSGPPAR